MYMLDKRRWIYVWIATMTLTGLSGFAQKENFISYLGAAWGPDGDSIYFIKRIDSQEEHLWLCKMNWDGTDKKEIRELWPSRRVSIKQHDPIWLEVNAATSNIAFSVEYGSDVGIWIVGMDGNNQHRPWPFGWHAKDRWLPLHPSWSPDGTKLVYEEDDCNAPTSSVTRLALYDLQKKVRRQLTDGPRDQHPVWSPKGDWIVFTHYVQINRSTADRRIWLIRPDGSEQKPVVDENGKPIFGWWPSWNPEGTKVSITDAGALKFATLGQNKVEWSDDPLLVLGECSPYTFLGHHWGKRGWLMNAIRLLNADTHSARMLARAGVYKCTNPNSDEARWGSAPQDIPRRVAR